MTVAAEGRTTGQPCPPLDSIQYLNIFLKYKRHFVKLSLRGWKLPLCTRNREDRRITHSSGRTANDLRPGGESSGQAGEPKQGVARVASEHPRDFHPSCKSRATVIAGIPRIALRIESDTSPSNRTSDTASAPLVASLRPRANVAMFTPMLPSVDPT